MHKPYIFVLLYILLGKLSAWAQPGTYKQTPLVPFKSKYYNEEGLVPKKVKVAPKFYSMFDTSRTLNIPAGYEIHLFHMGGLTKPRVLEIDDKGVLHVIDFTSNGAIYALPDTNNDNVADGLKVVVSGINAHCFKFYKEHIYVAEQTRVLKCSDLDKDGVFETKEILINNLASQAPQPTGGHTSRTILIDEKKGKLYVSIGSLCNVCREDYRAIIEEYNLDGSGRRIIATGTRNAVGLALNPITQKLWANNNGSDRQGDDVPPEWIDWVRDSGYYGYPFAYGHQNWFNFDAHSDYTALKPITKADSSKVSKMHHPAALIQAHSAPMEMEWISLTSTLENPGFLTALRGSWNRSIATGFKVVLLKGNFFKDSVNSYSDFVSGFLTDSLARKYWGRPVGLAVKANNNRSADVYISSDEGSKFILKLVGNHIFLSLAENERPNWKVYPNPVKDILYFEQALAKEAILQVYTSSGQLLLTQNVGSLTQVDLSSLDQGVYYLKVESVEGIMHKVIVKENE